jgi:hypothetical protein
VKNNTEMPSLLPYLEPGGAKIRLKFSLISQDKPSEEKPGFPFVQALPWAIL